jgi:hypothetical protein
MHLERWMVDEIVDDDVRVLRAALRASAADDLEVEGAFGATREVESLEARVVVNRDIAFRVENGPIDQWTLETEAQFDRPLLTAFLVGGASLTAAPGLPVRDQLREGDVYWVIDATAEADGRRAAHDLTVDQTPALLLELAAHGAEVWDVTAAARQVMKRLFGEAAFARADERRTENA